MKFVHTGPQEKIIIQNGAAKKIPQLVKKYGKQFVLVTDTHVAEIAEKILHEMERAGLRTHMIVLPAGEKSKNPAMIEKIARELMKIGLRRDGCLLAVGGGVVGDIAGFAASVYLRGIPFLQIPTTLIAMADSALGGKNGVNLEEGKNLLGTFYRAKAILMDPLLLATLPERDFRCGMAEIIKHAVIADANFFRFLKKNTAKILKRNTAVLPMIIRKSAAIKLRIVEKDERESTHNAKSHESRMLLNYGHTVGHALEKLSGYTLPHGEGVAIGMVAENRLAVGKKLLRASDADEISQLLRDFGLPVKIPAKFTAADIKKTITADKKNFGGKLHFALATGIGRAKVVHL